MTDEARTETCPRCGAARDRDRLRGYVNVRATWTCATVEFVDGRTDQSYACMAAQRDALQARVAELERERNDAVAEQILAESERDAAESRAEALARALDVAHNAIERCIHDGGLQWAFEHGPDSTDIASDVNEARRVRDEALTTAPQPVKSKRFVVSVEAFNRVVAERNTLAGALRRARLRLLDETFVSASPTIRKRLTDLAETIEQDLTTAPQPAATGRGGDRG